MKNFNLVKQVKSGKILLSVPGITARGGVTTYFQVIKKEYTFDVIYLMRGNRTYPSRSNIANDLYRIMRDTLVFLYHVAFKSYDLVQTNTSFYRNSIVRDSVFILLAKLFRIKTIVFFHGWDETLEKNIEKRLLNLFRYFYFKADACIVLSVDFKNKLIEWGYNKPVHVETTIVDRELLENINEQKIVSKFINLDRSINILFLARIEKIKGIYEALRTFELLKQKNTRLVLTVVGDGQELENIKKYAVERSLTDINFLGFKMGTEIAKAFAAADIYLFPSYTEGMPTSVLEAMAFGLPIITRPVGGLKDFFEDGKMGYLTETLDPVVFADLIEKLLLDPEKMKAMAVFNYHYARHNFLSDIVVKRIEHIYNQTISFLSFR
jgi:glycosyltransferase involved in cell wall biosynthesis